MDYSEKWEVGEMIGEGGQGKVYRVIPRSMGHYSVDTSIIQAIKEIASPQRDKDYREMQFEQFKKNLFKLFERQNPINQKALKVLHKLPKDARDFELAEERRKNEIKAMSETPHPNLLNIVDHDLDSKWFVSD